LKESHQVLSIASDLCAEAELTELLNELGALALAEFGAGRGEGTSWKLLPEERGAASDL
jgi:hypothetical protein